MMGNMLCASARMKTVRDKADKELVALQRAVTPEEIWRACNGLLRALGPATYTLIGLPSLGIVPFFLRTTMPDPEEFFAEFSKVAPLLDIIEKFPGIRVSRMSDHFTPTPEFHEKYMAPKGWEFAMGMLFWDAEGNYIGQVSASRSRDVGDFTDEEIAVWEVYHPHVNAAIQRLVTLERAAAARHYLEKSVRSLPLPIVAVGWDLEVSYANHSGREALHYWNHGDAARTLNSSGEVAEDIRDVCRHLRKGWETAVHEHTLSQTELSRRLDHASLEGFAVTVEVVEPVAGRVMQPSFALQFHLPESAKMDASAAIDALRKLTPAEQEIARLAASGEGNAGIAEKLAVSESTVRTHLRNIFAKLKISRRSELAPLLLAAAV
jgi:DNA-binding CsgD family transcriptional regulator